MKCKNKFCYMFSKDAKGNCSVWYPDQIDNCPAKKRFDRFVLINGIGEIETEEESSDGK